MSAKGQSSRKIKNLETVKSGDLTGKALKNLKHLRSYVKATSIEELHKDENAVLSETELSGAPLKRLKQQTTETSLLIKDHEIKKKNVSVQVNLTNTITEEDLTNTTSASNIHWKTLAEKRQKTIDILLEEKYHMRKKIEEVEKELALHKQMLEEANSFVEVVKELTNNSDNNDTGIDVNEIEDESEES